MADRKFSLDDYVDVSERIALFIEKYPDGSLQSTWDTVVVAEQTFVVCYASAYRTPDDKRPGQGLAWEPFPGTTPYTRGSELMNSQTSSWGRAIVALGLTANRKIASRQEVQARQGGDTPDPKVSAPTDKQLKYLRSLVTKHKPPDQTLGLMLSEVGFDWDGESKWTPRINMDQASALIEMFKEGTLPTGSSDIPSDPPPVETGGDEGMPWTEELPSKEQTQQMLDEARAQS